MTACKHYRNGLYVRQENCLAGIENYGGLGTLPCLHRNQGECEGHAIRDEDQPMEWAPVGKHNHAEVKRRSMLNFGDNPGQDANPERSDP